MGKKDAESEEEPSEEEETETPESEEIPSTAENIIKLKIGDTEETYNIGDETQKSKLIEFAQKGRHYEQKMSEVKQLETKIAENQGLLNKVVGAAQVAYINSISNGEIILNEPDWADYATDINFDSEAAAKEAYRKDKELYKVQTQQVMQYTQALANSSAEYQKQKTQFLEKHPEISDFSKWVKENVDKYLDPVFSYGSKPLPNDFFDMIHFWNNKNQYEQKIREEERKKVATAKPKTKAPSTVREKGKSNFNDSFLDALAQSDSRKLIIN